MVFCALPCLVHVGTTGMELAGCRAAEANAGSAKRRAPASCLDVVPEGRTGHLLTAPRSTDQSRLLAGYVIVLKRMVPDKNVQVEAECLAAATAAVCHEVFLAAAALLHTVCQARPLIRKIWRAAAGCPQPAGL